MIPSARKVFFCVLLSGSLFISEEKLPLKIFCLICCLIFNVVLIIINTFGCYLACFAALVAAFGYLVSSCFGNTMYYTAPLFFIFLGMGNMPFEEADETQTTKQMPDQGNH